MRALVLAPLLAACLSTSAFAHGGVWRPPGGDVSQPGSAGAPTTGGRGGATVGGGVRKGSPDLDRWDAWWYFQREAYLPRHTVGRTGGNDTLRTTGFLTGRAAPSAGPAGPLLPDDSRARVLPVLVAALKDRSAEVVDAAAVALGRSVETAAGGPFLPPLEKTLAHSQRTPQQAAVLGLGILGGAESAALLREIAVDSEAGRKLCDATGPLDDLLRGLAVLALGLTNQRENVAILAEVARSPQTPRDVAGSAVLALGLHRDSAPAAASELVKLLDDATLEREVRAQVPIALHRLPDTRGLLPRFVEMLRDEKTTPLVARSLTIALGNLALPEETEVVDLLLTTAKRHSDSGTRHFAMLSMGRLFERSATATEDAKALRQKAQEWLLVELREPDRRTNRPYAALALALIGRGDRASAVDGRCSALSQLSGAKLLETFDDEKDPSLRGAIAISLGLLQPSGAGPKLVAELDLTENPVLKGYFATALGLLGERSAIPKLRALLQDRSLAPAVRIEVARALGMLEDRAFEQQLLELLARAEDLPQAAACAKAIGLLGGRASVDPLLALAQDANLPEFRRAFAVVSLGLLSEKTEMPWNAPYLIDANFTTLLRPLQEIFDIL
jgi:HEAT repeat protein